MLYLMFYLLGVLVSWWFEKLPFRRAPVPPACAMTGRDIDCARAGFHRRTLFDIVNRKTIRISPELCCGRAPQATPLRQGASLKTWRLPHDEKTGE
jgi:hypothetical protein